MINQRMEDINFRREIRIKLLKHDQFKDLADKNLTKEK